MLNEQIRQIAMRLRGLREAMEYTPEQVAEACEVTVEEYNSYESGDSDIPMNFLCNAARTMGVEPAELISGDEATMSNYWLVRRGHGAVVERQKAYRYQALALGFKRAKAAPFIVTVEPKEGEEPHLNTHSGQEFNMVLEGRMLIRIGRKELVLGEGDSLYFDATQPHGMMALDGKVARMFAIIL